MFLIALICRVWRRVIEVLQEEVLILLLTTMLRSGSTFGTTGSNSTPFGANKPAFGTGATSSGGLFSATPSASTSTFGGFGGNSTGNTSGGLFGAANKPAFGGTQGTSGGGLFGSGSGFGSQSNQATSAFGAPLSSALGPNSAECQGTGSTPFQAFTEKEGTGTQMNHFQSISFMGPYKNFSFEVSLKTNEACKVLTNL